MDTSVSALHLTLADGVATVTLDRPDKFNALSTQVFDELERVLEKLTALEDARVVLVRTSGKHFCTGADLGEVLEAVDKGDRGIEDYLAAGQSALRRLETYALPVVVAVQGLCLAGGLELVLACDVVFAAKSARFGDQHANFGFLPGWGGSFRLAQLLGTRRATDLLFSGRAITAPEAVAWGLANYLSDDEQLVAEATAYCVQLTQRSRPGLTAMKRLAAAAQGGSLDKALKAERTAVIEQLQSRDGREGLAAFREKRKPRF